MVVCKIYFLILVDVKVNIICFEIDLVDLVLFLWFVFCLDYNVEYKLFIFIVIKKNILLYISWM